MAVDFMEADSMEVLVAFMEARTVAAGWLTPAAATGVAGDSRSASFNRKPIIIRCDCNKGRKRQFGSGSIR
jgi:hypothetical protein